MRTAVVRVTERYWAGGTGWRAGSASPPGPCRPGGGRALGSTWVQGTTEWDTLSHDPLATEWTGSAGRSPSRDTSRSVL